LNQPGALGNQHRLSTERQTEHHGPRDLHQRRRDPGLWDLGHGGSQANLIRPVPGGLHADYREAA
jgi:hypothetical protein